MTTDPPRISKAALFKSLGYEPHPGQLLVHRSRASRRVLACGVRWGKSTCGSMEALAAMMAPRERSIGWVVGPTHDLANRVFAQLVELTELHLKHRIREISARDQRIVLTNLGGGTSIVRGKSADRPASLLGEGLDWMVVDEAAELSREVWDSHLSQRLIDRHGWALLMSTPRGPGWFLRMFRRGQGGRDADYESWALPSSMNPHLDAGAIEAERARLPDEDFREQYLAEFVNKYSEPCDRCGGPSKTAVGILILDDDSEPARCPECDLAVGPDGNTLVALRPDGTARFEIIREYGHEWPLGAPDELIAPETLARDEEQRQGPSTRLKWDLSPEQVELAKAGVPVKEWPKPDAAPQVPEVKRTNELKKFVPGPLRSTADYDD